ncbi:MAG: helix-hairpin-helix domain-containing protein [Candidatus Latescibacteria bacterium]|nr:helix-hairpin-helix domain-containing protein [Candidatus Latescibacterota bacterium]
MIGESVQLAPLVRNVLFTSVFLLTLIGSVPMLARAEVPLGIVEEEDLHAVSAELEGVRMDLNRATAEELQTLPWISMEAARRITTYRARRGPIRRIDELARVHGITWETVETLRPYLFVSVAQRTTARSSWRLTRPSDGQDAWSGLRVHQRADLEVAGLLRGHLLVERDPGETGMTDFWSGHLLTTAAPGFERILVGDFRPGIGQGLLLSRRTRTPRGFAWARPGSAGRIGYRSSTENGSLRGLYAEARTGSLIWTVIYSRTAWDAVADSTGSARLRQGGEHVSQAQRKRKNALKERVAGVRVAGRVASARLGLLIMRTAFGMPLAGPAGPRSALGQIGVDGSLRLRMITLFGELAGGLGHAWLAGAAARIGTFHLRLLGRHYSPTFLALRGAPFSAYSGPPENEWGRFLGVVWRPWSTTRVQAEVDSHGRIVPKPPMSESATGSRSTASLTQRAGPFTLQLSLSSREKTVVRSGVTGVQWRRSIRAAASTRGSTRLRCWYALVRGGSPAGSGTGRAAGLALQVRTSSGLGLSVSGALFQVDTYDARLYTSEPDVWGGSRLVVLSGRGHVAGVRIGWHTRWCRAVVRYSIKRRETGTASSWALQIEWHPMG